MTRDELSALRKGDRIVRASDLGELHGVVTDYGETAVYVTWTDGGHGILRIENADHITREVAP